MKKKAKIEYTQTFVNSLDNLTNYLSNHSDETSAIEKIEEAIEQFEDRVINFPLSCQISPILMTELGVSIFREYNESGFRILYRAEEEREEIIIQADLILSQKQSIQKALVDYCLIYK